MFSSGARIYRKFRNKNATILLRDSKLAEEEIERIVNSPDYKKIDLDVAIEKANKKIERWQTQHNKVIFYASLPYFLLFASIIGVTFEISFLSIKLSSVERLKEVILVGFAVAGLYTSIIGNGIETLRKIRRNLYQKKYGDNSSEFMEYLFEDEIPKSSMKLIVRTNKYSALWPKLTIETLRIIAMGSQILLILALYAYVSIIIASNIWFDSNLGHIWGRILILLLYSISGILLITAAAKSIFTFKYVDLDKAADLSVEDPETGKILVEVKELITLDAKFWRIVQAVFVFLLLSAYYIWFAFSIFI